MSAPRPRKVIVTPDLTQTPDDDAATLRRVYDLLRAAIAARRAAAPPPLHLVPPIADAPCAGSAQTVEARHGQ